MKTATWRFLQLRLGAALLEAALALGTVFALGAAP
jgi:hypothetical protein